MRFARLAWFVALFVLACATVAMADGGRLTLGVDGGLYTPAFVHNRQDRFDTHAAGCYGGHLLYGVSDHTEIRVGGLVTRQDVEIDGGRSVDMVLQDIMLGVRWSVLTGPIRPLITLGGNYAIIKLDQPLQDESDFGMHAGLGMEFVLTRNLRLGVSAHGEYFLPIRFRRAWGLASLAFINITL